MSYLAHIVVGKPVVRVCTRCEGGCDGVPSAPIFEARYLSRFPLFGFEATQAVNEKYGILPLCRVKPSLLASRVFVLQTRALGRWLHAIGTIVLRFLVVECKSPVGGGLALCTIWGLKVCCVYIVSVALHSGFFRILSGPDF